MSTADLDLSSIPGNDSTGGTRPELCVLLTTFNRRETTLACLRSLFDQDLEIPFSVILVDDRSPDGTANAVASSFPEVELVEGSGSLYWSGGMRKAFSLAITRGYSGYLWLNDDVTLDRDALRRLWNASDALPNPTIVGGSMRGPEGTGAVYGGCVRSGASPFKYRFVQPDDEHPSWVDTLHGNLLLIPHAVAVRVGSIADYLIHQAGDFEYCLRAKRIGIASVLAPGTYGVCPPNPSRERQRGLAGLKRALSPKELPFSANVRLYREYGGRMWPFWLVVPYIKAILVGF